MNYYDILLTVLHQNLFTVLSSLSVTNHVVIKFQFNVAGSQVIYGSEYNVYIHKLRKLQ